MIKATHIEISITKIKSRLMEMINASIKESGLNESELIDLFCLLPQGLWHLKSFYSSRFTIDELLVIADKAGCTFYSGLGKGLEITIKVDVSA